MKVGELLIVLAAFVVLMIGHHLYECWLDDRELARQLREQQMREEILLRQLVMVGIICFVGYMAEEARQRSLVETRRRDEDSASKVH